MAFIVPEPVRRGPSPTIRIVPADNGFDYSTIALATRRVLRRLRRRTAAAAGGRRRAQVQRVRRAGAVPRRRAARRANARSAPGGDAAGSGPCSGGSRRLPRHARPSRRGRGRRCSVLEQRRTILRRQAEDRAEYLGGEASPFVGLAHHERGQRARVERAHLDLTGFQAGTARTAPGAGRAACRPTSRYGGLTPVRAFAILCSTVSIVSRWSACTETTPSCLRRGEPPAGDDAVRGESAFHLGQARLGQAAGVRGHHHELAVGWQAEQRRRLPGAGLGQRMAGEQGLHQRGPALLPGEQEFGGRRPVRLGQGQRVLVGEPEDQAGGGQQLPRWPRAVRCGCARPARPRAC